MVSLRGSVGRAANLFIATARASQKDRFQAHPVSLGAALNVPCNPLEDHDTTRFPARHLGRSPAE